MNLIVYQKEKNKMILGLLILFYYLNKKIK